MHTVRCECAVACRWYSPPPGQPLQQVAADAKVGAVQRELEAAMEAAAAEKALAFNMGRRIAEEDIEVGSPGWLAVPQALASHTTH